MISSCGISPFLKNLPAQLRKFPKCPRNNFPNHPNAGQRQKDSQRKNKTQPFLHLSYLFPFLKIYYSSGFGDPLGIGDVEGLGDVVLVGFGLVVSVGFGDVVPVGVGLVVPVGLGEVVSVGFGLVVSVGFGDVVSVGVGSGDSSGLV